MTSVDSNIITETGHGTGGIPDRVDLRDYQFKEIGFGTPPFDWSVGFNIENKVGVIKPKDQGTSGSCGGQAWSTLAAVLEAIQTGTFEERSAKFIYSQVYVPGGGSTGRDCANIYVNDGAATELVLPSYQNGQPPSETFMERSGDITDGVRSNAKLDRSFSYSQVEPASLDSIAQSIRDNNGAIFLINGQNNGTWLSAFPKTPTAKGWAHWIYAGRAKLINGKKFIGCLNSWGNVGENGWQWLAEDYFTSGNVLSCWTHTLATPQPPFTYKFYVNLAYGDNGTEVIALQKVLQTLGIFPSNVPPSGFYGGITATALLAFRVKYGVSSASDPLGHSCGPLTRAKLNSIQ